MSNTLVFRKIADFIKRFTNNGDDEETNDGDEKTDETIDNEGNGNDPVDEKWHIATNKKPLNQAADIHAAFFVKIHNVQCHFIMPFQRIYF